MIRNKDIPGSGLLYHLLIPLAGVLFGLSFPPVDLSFLIFFSFAIQIFVISRTKSFKSVFLRSYLIYFTASVTAVSWVMFSGMRENADRFLIAGGIFILLTYPLFFVMPLLVFYKIKNSFTFRNGYLISLILFPVIWTGFEYISTLGQINFPWLFAGNTMTYQPSKIQYAEITGIFGVSFWVCCISVMLYLLFYNIIEKKKRIISSGNITIILILMFVYFFPDFYNSNLSEHKNYDSPFDEKIRIGIIQPNTDPWKKWGGRQSDLIKGYISQIGHLRDSSPDKIDLFILPETALPYYFRERYFEDNLKIIKSFCDSINTPVLIGTPDLEYYEDQDAAPVDAKIMRSTGKKYDTYNSAVLFEPEKDVNEFQRHRKIKLVIGSERMAYQEYLPFTKSLIEWGVGLGSWQIGNDTNIFVLNIPDNFKNSDNTAKFNTAVCYESVYPEFFADFVNRGADFCVIITNDGWWGKFFGTYQHNQFAVFRAIENRRWIARCANTGISDFISPYGELFQETAVNEKAEIVREISLIKEKTFYTRHGDILARNFLYISLLVFLLSFFVKIKNKE